MYEFEDQRTNATVEEFGVRNVETSDFPFHRPATKEILEEDEWNLKKFKKNLSVVIIKEDENYLEFDIVGLDCSIANAFRRILISEIPTMAIEKVFFYYNTSLFQEEFLAHRLGLIPIKADAKLFTYPTKDYKEGTPEDTIVFELKAKCKKNPEPPSNSILPKDIYLNRNIYSKMFKWIPLGNQQEIIVDPPKPVYDDILIAKLSDQQELDLKLHCCKGIGRDHAKFSPVSTATYRLLPIIEILEEIKDDDAKELQKYFSKGVIGISSEGTAFVENSRYDSCSRNVFLSKNLKNKVRLGLKKDHFIFTIESTGCKKARELLLESIEILMSKAQKHLNELESLDDDELKIKVKTEI